LWWVLGDKDVDKLTGRDLTASAGLFPWVVFRAVFDRIFGHELGNQSLRGPNVIKFDIAAMIPTQGNAPPLAFGTNPSPFEVGWGDVFCNNGLHVVFSFSVFVVF
jgi:hypothetical protein